MRHKLVVYLGAGALSLVCAAAAVDAFYSQPTVPARVLRNARGGSGGYISAENWSDCSHYKAQAGVSVAAADCTNAPDGTPCWNCDGMGTPSQGAGFQVTTGWVDTEGNGGCGNTPIAACFLGVCMPNFDFPPISCGYRPEAIYEASGHDDDPGSGGGP